jgi:hypothetical protein
MASKPTVKPEWATDAAADIVTPSAGKQASGYVEGEMPPAPEQNWLHLKTYEWIDWLDDGDCDFAALSANSVTTDEGGIRHAACEEPISVHACASSAGTRTTTKIAHGSGFSVWMPITGKVGSKITSARARLNDLGGADWSADLVKMDLATRTETVIQGATGAGGDSYWTATPASPETIATGYTYYLKCTSGAGGGEAYGGSVTISRTA